MNTRKRRRGEPKPWYQSKTIWLNAVTFAAGMLAVIQVTPNLLPDSATPWIVLALAGCNLLLRLVTGEPLAGTPADTGKAQSSGGGAPE